MGLSEASRKFNVAVETLRTQTPGLVSLASRPGPLIVDLIANPAQIFNADETRVIIVHRPAKEIAQIGRHNVTSVMLADKRKDAHYICMLICWWCGDPTFHNFSKETGCTGNAWTGGISKQRISHQ